jgi:hypothetical protein
LIIAAISTIAIIESIVSMLNGNNFSE